MAAKKRDRTGLSARRVSSWPNAAIDRASWPATLPAVKQLLDDGLELGPLTVLIGENGSGKSTLVEAIALAYGMSHEGGSTGAQHSTRPTESSLWEALQISRDAGSSRWGFFLRAETMHGFYTYLEHNPGAHEPNFHELSHGESFLAVLASRFNDPGLYLLDEPESALSFSGCLALVGLLHDISVRGNAQAIVATHSPIIAAVPGAIIYEVGEWGLRPAVWDELTLVEHWRAFLAQPERYLRHVLTR